jgi:hypothetical protein
LKTGKSLLQKTKFPRDEQAEVHAGGVEVRHVGEVILVQQSVLDQTIETDQVRVSRKRRKALIGRVTIPGGTQRKHLPEFAAGGGEPVHKAICLRTQVADPVRTRQAGGVKEDSA